MTIFDDWLPDDPLDIEPPDDDTFNPSQEWLDLGWEDWMADAVWNFVDYLDTDSGYFG